MEYLIFPLVLLHEAKEEKTVKKKTFAKILSVLLAAVMIMTVLAGCGGTAPAGSSEAAPVSSVEESKEEAAPASSEEAAPASEAESSEEAEAPAEEREPVELVWYTFAGKLNPGMDATIDAINEYLKEKLNTTIDFHFYTNSEYNESVSTIFNSGTYMDCLISGASRVSFNQNVQRNGFAALDDYIDEYLPQTKATLPQTAWDAYSFGGHIYAVPPIKDLATNYDMVWNQTMADDLGVAIPETYDTFGDLIDTLYAVKAARDAKYPDKADQPIIKNINNFEGYYYMEPFLGSVGLNNVLVAANIPGMKGFEGQGDGSQVFCPFYTEEYLEWAKLMRQLVVDGIVPFDAEEFDQDKVLEEAGELIGEWNIGLLYLAADDNPYYTSKLVCSDNAILTTVGMQSGGFAIPAQSEHIERTLEVIELLNTDQYLATVIRFGPEGEGWTDEDNDGVIELTEQNSDPSARYWYNWYGWNLGAFTTSKVIPGVPANYGEMVTELNQTATPASNLGFVFNQEPVANEIAACSNVLSEYHKVLRTGQNDNVEEMVADFVAKLKASGMDTILEECQKQLDEWRAARG